MRKGLEGTHRPGLHHSTAHRKIYFHIIIYNRGGRRLTSSHLGIKTSLNVHWVFIWSVAVRYSGADVAEYEPRVKRYCYSAVIHHKCAYAMKRSKERSRSGFHCGEKTHQQQVRNEPRLRLFKVFFWGFFWVNKSVKFKSMQSREETLFITI